MGHRDNDDNVQYGYGTIKPRNLRSEELVMANYEITGYDASGRPLLVSKTDGGR